MLQAFLQQLVPALEESIKLAVPLGILLAIILPLPNQSIRHTFVRVLKWGFFLSLFMTAVRVGTKSAVNREIFESMAIGVDLGPQRRSASSASEPGRLRLASSSITGWSFG